MDPTKYCKSSFGQSLWCQKLNDTMQMHVKDKMVKLANYGIKGAIAARIFSVVVGPATLVGSLALRVMNVVEPIIGIFADMGVAAYYRDLKPLKNIGSRVVAIPKNLFKNVAYGIWDVFKIGLIATVGGILAPAYTYGILSDKTPKRVSPSNDTTQSFSYGDL